jgi:hypothetical protein
MKIIFTSRKPERNDMFWRIFAIIVSIIAGIIWIFLSFIMIAFIRLLIILL